MPLPRRAVPALSPAVEPALPALHPALHPGLQLVPPPPSPLAQEVLRGLSATPKFLSPWLFYDERGSLLFEDITALPEYYLTRAERSIFAANADAIIALARARSRHPLHILELGAGTAAKTGLLLAAAARLQHRVLYQPIDVSASALEQARHQLEASLPGVTVEPHVADYTRGYGHLARPAGPRLALFIGSSIGNFEPAAALQLLRQLRSELRSGDSLLLGVDLRKDPAMLLEAYNDAQGVTAAFNKNVLLRINRELGANFRLDRFQHRAVWNSRLSRIEMHLFSTRTQTVDIAALDLGFQFAAGESIHTENSYKYTRARLATLLTRAGFKIGNQWTDPDSLFLVTLAAVGAKPSSSKPANPKLRA
jgi:dimethylhistidine N-methyltransferase